jgi:hypothetical protein
MHAQFVELPPLEDIIELYKTATGGKFHLEETWRTWNIVHPDDLYVFQSYIRPCHRKLLNDTANGIQTTPCSFLRQLLRPYNYSIVYDKNTYSLQEFKAGVKTVVKKDGVVVEWGGVKS